MSDDLTVRFGRAAWDNAYPELKQAAAAGGWGAAFDAAEGDGASRMVTLTAPVTAVEWVVREFDEEACLSPSMWGAARPRVARVARDAILKQLAALGIDRSGMVTDLDAPDLIDGEFDGPAIGGGIEDDDDGEGQE